MPGPNARFVPREVCVFPRNPADSRAIALQMRAHGMLILARAPISGMILAATPIEGTEWITCQWLKTWPQVRAAEMNVFGESFQPQDPPLANCPITTPQAISCTESISTPYPDLQLAVPCPNPPPAGQPNDPAFCFQWGLHNSGQLIVDRSNWTGSGVQCWTQNAWPGIDINLLEAWEITTGSPLVTVAVLDSGVEYCNQDFDPNRFLYPDIALTCVGNDDPSSLPCCPPPGGSEEESCNFGPARDNDGHGTVVAGIIAAVAGNGIGVAGIDQQCRVLAGRVSGYGGVGPAYQNLTSLNAARLAIALETIASLPAYNSVRVINMSLGLRSDQVPAATLEALIGAADLLQSQNRFLVAAASNKGFGAADLYFPANRPNVFCVGSMDTHGRRVAPPWATDPLGDGTSATGMSLDFMAPGMAEAHLVCQSNPCPPCTQPPGPGLCCTYPTIACDPFKHRNFTQGTSWAAPKVAAAISLILAEAIELGVVNPTPAMNPETWPGLTFLQMYDLLKAGARDQVSYMVPGGGDPLDTPNPPVGAYDQYYGWGLIDIRASLCALRTLAGQPCP